MVSLVASQAVRQVANQVANQAANLVVNQAASLVVNQAASQAKARRADQQKLAAVPAVLKAVLAKLAVFQAAVVVKKSQAVPAPGRRPMAVVANKATPKARATMTANPVAIAAIQALCLAA